MSKNEWKKLVGVAGRMLVGYALIFSQCAWAGQNAKTADKANSPQQTSAGPGEKQSSVTPTAKAQSQEVKGEASESTLAEEKSSGDASHQGIKVHGHWTIEVRNPNGALVTHREFENAYFPQGALLPSILSRANSVGFWRVALAAQSGETPPCALNGSPTACAVFEAQWPQGVNAASFKTLTVIQNAGTVVLSGNFVASLTGIIDFVETDNFLCPNTTAPSAPCGAVGTITASPFTTFQFTSATPGVNVSTGQTVAVTVNISFS